MLFRSIADIPSPLLALFVVMLLKAHLTSYSRMSGSRQVITSSWLSRSLKPFLYSSSVFSFIVQLSYLYMTTGKTITLTRWTFFDKVVSLLFNMVSRLVITFLPRSKHLLISWLQSLSAVILEPKKNKVSHCFPIYFP